MIISIPQSFKIVRKRYLLIDLENIQDFWYHVFIKSCFWYLITNTNEYLWIESKNVDQFSWIVFFFQQRLVSKHD